MKLLLFYTDEYFVRVFSDFISRNRPRHELLCYTSEEAARQWLEKNRVDLVLSEEGYLTGFIGKTPYITLGMNTIMPKENETGSLNIYQKASRLLEDLDRVIALIKGETKKATGNGKNIVFYSTEGGAGKTTLSYLMAVWSARNRKTAYWNLELLTDSQGLYQVEFPNTMEKLFYAQKSKHGLRELMFETLRQNSDGVYVLPVVQSFGDYRDLDIQAIQELCDEIHQLGIEWIFLDLPCGLCNFTEELLHNSEGVYWVFSDSKKGAAKESKVKNDPYLKELVGRCNIIRNCCERKSEIPGIVAAFPKSGTLQNATKISGVLEANAAFQEGCSLIEKNIAGK